MSGHPATPADLDRAAVRIQEWLAAELAGNPAVVAADRDPDRDARRWMIRLEGEDKPVFTVWFDLRQRSLHAETQLIPAPIEDPLAVYEYLLRANDRLRGVTLSVGAEDAVYARMDLPMEFIDDGQLDRMLGSLHETTERYFVAAMSLAFGDRFNR